MKFQRNTLILVGVAAVLSVAVLISEARRSQTDGEAGSAAVAGRDRLFLFEESDIAGLTIEKERETLVFERRENGDWQMLEPENVLAEQAAIAFLLNLVTTAVPSRVFTIEPDKQENFGLNSPTATVTLTLTDGETHTLLLGAADFSGGSLYAVTNPAEDSDSDSEPIEVAVVPIDFVNGVTRSQEEWKAIVEEPVEDSSEEPVENSVKGSENGTDDDTPEVDGSAVEAEEQNGDPSSDDLP